MIPYSRQSIDDQDIQSVVEVLKSNYLTQGPQVPLFEKNVNDLCGSKFAVAFNSATSALHVACLALGLKENDILWTSPISFVASANCGLYCKANIDFVDINSETFNIDICKLKEKLELAEKSDNLPKILVPVHMAGQSCDMEEIYTLSKIYGFKVIEDASHAFGASYKNTKVGSCKFSDITVFSFHPVKIITTGEGGVATTISSEIDEKLRKLRSHGIEKNKNNLINQSQGDWYYEQQSLGFNYRMNDIEAALGNSQVRKIISFTKERNKIAKYYDDNLNDLPIRKPIVMKYNYSSYHLYIIKTLEDLNGLIRKDLFNYLRSKKILVNVHYIPIHLQPYFSNLGFKEGDFPISERYYKNAISLPIFPMLTKDDQNFVIQTLKKFFK